MSNELIIYNDKIRKQDNLLISYLYSGLETGKKSYVDDFIFCITELYRIPLFACMLNAVITKIKHKEAEFKLMPLRSWDRVLGHCATATKEIKAQESVFNKGLFTKHHTIVIRSITPTIIIHEVGHAIEHIAGINVNGDFKTNLYDDFRANNSSSIQLKSAVKDVMQEQLKSYKLEQTMVELFARFFEMLAMSKEVGGWGNYQFELEDISIYFSNTVAWANDCLVPILKKKTDRDIEKASIDFVNSIEPYKKKWTQQFKSRFVDTDDVKTKWQELHETTEKNVKDTMTYFNNQQLSKLDNGVEYIDFTKKNK